MLQHPAAVRDAFEQGAITFLDVLRAVPSDQWDKPGALGTMTTRELAAHTLRAFVTIEGYLVAEPQTDRVLADAGEYYIAALSDPNVHDGVANRARQAGRQLIDPVGEAEVTVARVLALVAATANDDPVNTFLGQMTLSEYLATRVVELGVHTLDLARATDQPAELHSDTAGVVLSVLTQLASPTQLILAFTGRQSLPADYNLLR
ncbi:MAG: maleylpyruvate isomerase N-terminal domain-containing protein [Actinomycetia bacterium]|nr:maleylpyruvate isomerase N-terminal domain-containing protein [Actinomycetes bacterium]